MWADLCAKCLRECKQNKESEIISCHFFTEQLGLKFKKSKKRKNKKKNSSEIKNKINRS